MQRQRHDPLLPSAGPRPRVASAAGRRVNRGPGGRSRGCWGGGPASYRAGEPGPATGVPPDSGRPFGVRLFRVRLFRVRLSRVRLFRARLSRVRLFRVRLFRVRLFRVMPFRVRRVHRGHASALRAAAGPIPLWALAVTPVAPSAGVSGLGSKLRANRPVAAGAPGVNRQRAACGRNAGRTCNERPWMAKRMPFLAG